MAHRLFRKRNRVKLFCDTVLAAPTIFHLKNTYILGQFLAFPHTLNNRMDLL